MHRFAELGTIGSPGMGMRWLHSFQLCRQGIVIDAPQSAQSTLCTAGAGTNSMVSLSGRSDVWV